MNEYDDSKATGRFTNSEGAYLCTSHMRTGKRIKPAKPETREQVIARNSFPGPDQNRHIDKFLKEQKE